MQTIIYLSYLVASVLFMFGIKLMARVRSSRKGNQLAAVAMLIAIVATLVDIGTINYTYIIAGAVIGSLIGGIAAVKVAMTAMPEMVALFNGMGGGASVLVGLSYLYGTISGKEITTMNSVLSADVAITIALSIIIGGVTFSGSIIAFAKLKEIIGGKPTLFPGQNLFNAIILISALAVGGYVCFVATGAPSLILFTLILTGVALVLGVLAVIPIGGADMPVIISLLNSYSGLAAAMTGFVLQNNLLIISGSLVGAAGLILTKIMCKAMNRSLGNVLFAGFGADSTAGAGSKTGYTNIKESGPEEAAMILESADSVVFVPGYGLAVAQAQHVVKEIADILQKRGVKVSYAIHPVAGRMPGHMNVLLAEANVPYDQLIEMDDINPEFKNTTVSIVVGANDVVNPAALHDKSSPIFGMPILHVQDSQTVFVLKRSLAAGFAGVTNELFDYPNTLMLFGDAKKTLTTVEEELKELN